MGELLWVEIDLKQIKQNILEIEKLARKRLIPVIKSNAYNLGDTEIIELVNELNLKYGAVVDMTEAIKLLDKNPNYRLLILNSLLEQEYDYLEIYPNLAISVNSLRDVENLKKLTINRVLNVHIQIDSGMNRLGFKDFNEYTECIDILKQLNYIKLEGLYTHFSSLKNANNQVLKFKEYTNVYPFEMIHTSASSTFRTIDFGNYVRVGVDVYGSNKEMQAIKVVSKPIAINQVKKGETIGYEETFVAKSDLRIAVLPIGYANGFRRSLGGYSVLANDKLYEVVGLVCMNHIFVLIDDNLDINTEFIITSKDHPIIDMANYLNTIPHEILCMLNIKSKKYIG